VRVEVIDGPKAGTFAMSDGNGRFELPPLNEGPVTVLATKEGYDSKTEIFYPEYGSAPMLRLGVPPHTMWGEVRLVSSTAPAGPVAQVQVEILDGPNAGKVAMSADNGLYRFDDLVASPPFTIRVTKPGFTTRTYSKPELRHNRRDDLPVHPE
jgi:ribosomal protein S28E/S33